VDNRDEQANRHESLTCRADSGDKTDGIDRTSPGLSDGVGQAETLLGA
jgi:hypothetical protein